MEVEIPRIDQNKNLESREGSILIPRINVVTEEVGSDPNSSQKYSPKKIFRKYNKLFFVAIGVLLLFLLVEGFLAYRLYTKVMAARNSANTLVAASKEQDLDKIKKELENTRTSLTSVEGAYKPFLWIKYIPFVGVYISDGEHALIAGGFGIESAQVVISAIEPYADIIGLSANGKEAASGEETTQDRIDFVVKSIPDLIPRTDLLMEKVGFLRKEVDQIDPNRYPETFMGKSVRGKLSRGIELVDTASEFIENGKPLLESAPYLLGMDDERRYLILFQNDKELRPTGGFITAYSEALVNKGRFEPVSSSDIYNLDEKYTPKVAAPDPIVKYIKGPYLLSKKLRLRDMNWSPDFSESMGLFSNEIKSVGIKNIDGIIAVDTQVLVNILDVIGPIQVPGFGEFSTKITPECNCPQVIYELESFADIEGPVVWSQDEPGKIIFAPPNYDNRKKIIGPLMNSILANALGQPKDKLPQLFEAGIRSFVEKHIIFFVLDQKPQEALKKFGIAGTLSEFEGDYLHINDANLGGRKSNLYVTQEVSQEVEIAKEGSVTKTLTITYKNPQKHDGWLNSVLPNWVRIYVPKGSEILEFEGVEEKVDAYEEFGKSVFAGFFKLRPEGISKLTLKYKLPFKVDKEYRLFLQKQPGTDKPLYNVQIGKKKEEFFLKTDKEIKFDI